ncbi:MAG: YbhB/YbcL family Raf kinase inhibitor-like protein [Bauldia sp.]
MRAFTALSALAFSVFVAAPAFAQAPAAPATPPPPAMVLTSTSFPDGGQIPVKYTQAGPGVAAGEGTSPALNWTNAPPGTQSFVLHVHDLEGARNKTTDDVLHWLVWPIPATTTSLPEGVARGAKLADGSYQVSATGPVFRGPGAPATGPMHHYTFEIYALDNMPAVEPAADAYETRTKVLAAIQGHILGKAVYSGLFRRPN